MLTSLDTFLAAVLLGSFALLAFAYGGYAALLWLLSRLTPPRPERDGTPTRWPTVSIVVSAYNEEAVIAERVRNLLAIDYPRDRLEILIGSDGSSDRTVEIVSACTDPAVRLVAFAQRRGKTSVVNDLVAQARGEVVVMTDANAFFAPDAVRTLVTALWRRPTACAVVGKLDLRAAAGGGNLDGIYWRYETWLKALESRFGAVLGANGAIYAFARARYRPLPAGAIVDDFLIPMLMRLHGGGEVFFVPAARATETCPPGVRHEMRRRIRIGAGDLQALLWTWRLLAPQRGMVALAYFSHKVLRWLGPWLLLTGFAANVALAGQPPFGWLLLGQLAFYALGASAPAVRALPGVGRAAVAARYFVVLNTALGLGFVRFALRRQRPFWSTAPRGGAPIPT